MVAVAFIVVLLSFPRTVASGPAPNLALSSVKVSPPDLMVGGVFEAEMLVVNLGTLRALTAVLNLALGSCAVPETFSILGSSTSFSIGDLDVGANRTLKATFAVSSYSATGPHAIPYTLTYSDENHYSYSTDGTFGVVIRGIPDVEIQFVSVDPAKVTPTVDGTLSLSFINIGTDVASNVTVKIYNDGGLLTSTVAYMGQLDRGAVKTLAFGIHADQYAPTGIRVLNITLSYIDSGGNRYAGSRAYDLRVYPLEPVIPYYYYPFIVGGVMFIVGLYIAFRKLGYRLW
jgi:hypothetical protein